MDLRTEILREHSKRQCLLIINHVSNSQTEFDKLFGLFIKDATTVMQRAGWPAAYLVRSYPFLIEKHLVKLIDYLKQDRLHQGCRRNGFAMLDAITIPEQFHGEVMDLCFKCFESPEESIAAKANILSILTKLAKVYPEIIPEIGLLIQFQSQPLPAAIRSRAKVFLDTCHS